MDTALSLSELKHKRTARIGATVIMMFLIGMLFIKTCSYMDPPPGQDGVLVSFGEPNIGQGDERAAPSAPAEAEPEPVEETVEEEVVEEEPEPVKEEPKVEPRKEEAQPDNKKVLEDAASKERALKKKREEAKKKREAEEAQKKRDAELAKKRAEAEKKRRAEEARKRAEEEARKKAEADAKAKADAKKKYGDLFGGSGSGQGNTGTPGNQGSPDGDPNSKALEGLGTGRVGGGLSNRGGSGPRLTDRSQKAGNVIVKVCVDSRGKVLSAKATQAGSTIWDQSLNAKVEANAKKWKFKSGSLDKQCGTITYTFKLK